MYFEGQRREDWERTYVREYWPRDDRLPRALHLPHGRGDAYEDTFRSRAGPGGPDVPGLRRGLRGERESGRDDATARYWRETAWSPLALSSWPAECDQRHCEPCMTTTVQRLAVSLALR